MHVFPPIDLMMKRGAIAAAVAFTNGLNSFKLSAGVAGWLLEFG
jgi:hypothetical protein